MIADTYARLNAAGTPYRDGVRQNSESVVVESPLVGYPSPFIGVC